MHRQSQPGKTLKDPFRFKILCGSSQRELLGCCGDQNGFIPQRPWGQKQAAPPRVRWCVSNASSYHSNPHAGGGAASPCGKVARPKSGSTTFHYKEICATFLFQFWDERRKIKMSGRCKSIDRKGGKTPCSSCSCSCASSTSAPLQDPSTSFSSFGMSSEKRDEESDRFGIIGWG